MSRKGGGKARGKDIRVLGGNQKKIQEPTTWGGIKNNATRKGGGADGKKRKKTPQQGSRWKNSAPGEDV